MTTPDLHIAVTVEEENWTQAIPDADDRCRHAVRSAWVVGRDALDAGHALAQDSIGPIEVSIVLSSDKTVHDLNRDHRGQDKPTNVLSFPGDMVGHAPGAEVLIGDVILAWNTCNREATEAGKPLLNHMSHLVVHGVLHLLGYDHESDDDATEMERLETDSLARLDMPDPYHVSP